MNLVKQLEEHEVVTNNYLPTKKEVQSSAVSFVKKLLDEGNYQREEVLAQAVRLSEGLNTIVAELKKSIPEEGFEMYGMKAQLRNGGDLPQFSDDPIWAELKKAITDREALLKVALKTETPFYDNEGVEVPKVSTKPRKSSLTITY